MPWLSHGVRMILEMLGFHYYRQDYEETVSLLHMLKKRSPDLMDDPEIRNVQNWVDDIRAQREERSQQYLKDEFSDV